VNGRQEVEVEGDGVQELEVELDAGPQVHAGPEVNAGQEMELEVDGGQRLGRGQGLEVNGRQEVEVELDGVQDVEQDVDSGLEVNRRRRRVGDDVLQASIPWAAYASSHAETPADIKCIAYKWVICDVCD
jgi:hypothetical protein